MKSLVSRSIPNEKFSEWTWVNWHVYAQTLSEQFVVYLSGLTNKQLPRTILANTGPIYGQSQVYSSAGFNNLSYNLLEKYLLGIYLIWMWVYQKTSSKKISWRKIWFFLWNRKLKVKYIYIWSYYSYMINLRFLIKIFESKYGTSVICHP